MRNNNATKKMQKAYQTYGEPSLEVLCECYKEELNIYENEALEIFNAVDNGFNTLESAESIPCTHGFESGNAKYTEQNILDVAVLLTEPTNTASHIEEITGVKIRTITEVSNLTRHAEWLQKEHSDLYNQLNALKGNRKACHNKNSASIRSNKMSAASRGIVYPLIKSPEGIVYNVTNTSAFAKEHSLHNGHLVALLNKKALSHKGWKLCPDEQAL
jgi:hypothetical protein